MRKTVFSEISIPKSILLDVENSIRPSLSSTFQMLLVAYLTCYHEHVCTRIVRTVARSGESTKNKKPKTNWLKWINPSTARSTGSQIRLDSRLVPDFSRLIGLPTVGILSFEIKLFVASSSLSEISCTSLRYDVVVVVVLKRRAKDVSNAVLTTYIYTYSNWLLQKVSSAVAKVLQKYFVLFLYYYFSCFFFVFCL